MQEAKDEDPAVTVGSGLHEGKEKEIAKQTGVARDTYELNMGRAVTRIKEISQDKLQSVLDGIRAIESELGVKVRDHDNPYMAANRGKAKASAQRELYRKKEEKDLLDTLFIVCLLHQTTTLSLRSKRTNRDLTHKLFSISIPNICCISASVWSVFASRTVRWA